MTLTGIIPVSTVENVCAQLVDCYFLEQKHTSSVKSRVQWVPFGTITLAVS